ncbi:DUF2237 domain-containing protein [Aquisalimonas sp.]|uniref:DUF2237 family protein n=1 Tax=Aquisalimonas sp. TaxID=1872621 RepID=UPI0025C5F5DE|nr:DUF2237 domain-containing protein [Aquisalimonas sp.]
MTKPFSAVNVFGGELALCSGRPLTGFYRDGCCNTGYEDVGLHTVCARMTEAFLTYSRSRGNDLMQPNPAMGFPGLRPGDCWCLCASRWLEAYRAGVAPGVLLESTHEETLAVIDLAVLKAHAIDA